MSDKKIVVLFPGIRGNEIPLLYFAGKKYEDLGYKEYFLGHPQAGIEDAEELYRDAKRRLSEIDLRDCEELVFVGKSIGTVICCRLKQEMSLKAKLILFTPLEQTLPYITSDNDILLVAAGDEDKWLSTDVLKEVCEQQHMNYFIENGVGHRMEKQHDLHRNVEVIEHVIGRIR